MKNKMHWPVRLLLATMALVSVFGSAGLAVASDEAQGAVPVSLTAANLEELLVRLVDDAILTIPARGERYVGTAQLNRYLRNAVPPSRTYTLVCANRTDDGFTALVEVSDRGVRWAQLTVSASVSGTELTRLEVASVRLLTWPG